MYTLVLQGIAQKTLFRSCTNLALTLSCTQDVKESCSNLALVHGKCPFSCKILADLALFFQARSMQESRKVDIKCAFSCTDLARSCSCLQESFPSKNELARSCKIVQESSLNARLAWHVHAICPFSCTILHQFLQDLAKNVQEMQVIILVATLAKSCTISCKICARLCKNRARKGTYHMHVPSKSCMQDSCTILHDLASSFCWVSWVCMHATSKNELARSCKIVQESCMQDLLGTCT